MDLLSHKEKCAIAIINKQMVRSKVLRMRLSFSNACLNIRTKNLWLQRKQQPELPAPGFLAEVKGRQRSENACNRSLWTDYERQVRLNEGHVPLAKFKTLNLKWSSNRHLVLLRHQYLRRAGCYSKQPLYQSKENLVYILRERGKNSR